MANEINLRISFGGSNFVKNISRVSIQSQNKVIHTFAVPMTLDGYERVGETIGNRVNALVEGTYEGLGNVQYKYSEPCDYDPELRRFVPIWAE